MSLFSNLARAWWRNRVLYREKVCIRLNTKNLTTRYPKTNNPPKISYNTHTQQTTLAFFLPDFYFCSGFSILYTHMLHTKKADFAVNKTKNAKPASFFFTKRTTTNTTTHIIDYQPHLHLQFSWFYANPTFPLILSFLIFTLPLHLNLYINFFERSIPTITYHAIKPTIFHCGCFVLK